MAVTDFASLCGTALGPGDYVTLADALDVLVLRDVPTGLGLLDINRVRRFITLMDALYDEGVRLFIVAAGPATSIFRPDGPEAQNYDEVFAFDRTVSRLMEMQSEEYQARALGARRAASDELRELDNLAALRNAVQPSARANGELPTLTHDDAQALFDAVHISGWQRLSWEELRALLSELRAFTQRRGAHHPTGSDRASDISLSDEEMRAMLKLAGLREDLPGAPGASAAAQGITADELADAVVQRRAVLAWMRAFAGSGAV